MMLRFATTLALVLFAQTAWAGPNLSVSIDSPQGVYVYETGTWSVTVENVGGGQARDTALEIQLPETGTSPQVHIMGSLDGFDSSCTLDETVLTCDMGRLGRNRSATVTFDLATPLPFGNHAVSATATARNASPATASAPLAPLAYDEPLSGDTAMQVRHCTGTALSSFFECTLYPSSISSHNIVLEAGGTIELNQPGYTGEWEQPADHVLRMWYYDANNDTVVDFLGFGVGNGCFEGITLHFTPTLAWTIPYEVCPQ